MSTYSLTHRQTQDLLKPLGIPSGLVMRIFSSFARRPKCSGSWSRVIDESPERRIDALGLFSGLALTCRGTVNDKLTIIFSLFDPSEAGVLTEDDLGAMVSSCASFLHRLGLSNKVSNDEASFAAGEPFGRQQAWAAGSAASFGSHTGSGQHFSTDEINFPAFWEWARSADLPTSALGLLELPHRLSRMVDLVSAKAGSLLRERYMPWANGTKEASTKVYKPTGGQKYTKKRALTLSPAANRLAQGTEANRQPRGSNIGFETRPFVLPPFLRRIGPHGASIVLEVGTNGAPATEGSTWRFVVSVEEREGSRFSSVDSEPVVLQGGIPWVLLLSKLKAATDHRLQISWCINCDTTRGKTPATAQLPPGALYARAKRSTLRFTTLPADAAMISLPSETPAEPSSTQMSPAASRRYIQLVSVDDARSWDALQVFQTKTMSTLAGSVSRGQHVSVLVRYDQFISLDSPDNNVVVDPWWSSTAEPSPGALMTRNRTDSDMLLRSWPPPAPAADNEQPLSPTVINSGDLHAFTAASNVAPCCGEEREPKTEEHMKGGARHQFWASQNIVGSGDIDLMVHLRPDWQAVEVIRRCFRVLEQCRRQTSVVREDGRRVVSSEITTAIRSLLSKSFRLQRRTSQDKSRRTCAHTILGGVKNPWLGLKEVS